MNYLLEPARIDWQDDTPRSAIYDDIYWHRGAAVAEKQQVFVDPLRVLAADCSAGTQLTVCELGFGFGINCLLSAAQWQADGIAGQLNLVSIEKHPVSLAGLRAHLAQYDFPHAAALIAAYPPPYQGHHVIWLAANIRLLLIFDDVDAALAGLDAQVDLWCLDGFAPSRNPEMWAARLYRRMFARSRPGARVVTYSAASAVRQGLLQSGFSVSKRTGFGQKKEMLQAQRTGDWQPMPHRCGSVAIIGAGIAGLYCAEALQKRQASFSIIDSGEPGASTVPQLAMFPQLAVRAEARYRFSLAASRYMLSSPGFHQSGMTWHGRTTAESQRLAQIAALFPDELLQLLPDGACRFAEAGWLSPQQLAAALDLEIHQHRITAVRPLGNQWQLATETTTVLESSEVILATGAARALLPAQLQIRAVRGQAIAIASEDIGTVLNGKVTIFPSIAGRSIVSGTYERSTRTAVSNSDSEHLVNSAAGVLDRPVQALDAHVGIRAVSRDRLPVVGTMPDWPALDSVNRVSGVTRYQAGLQLCTAFGSRGATHARLCAEQLVSRMLGEPAALDLKQQQLLSPARFYLRDRQHN